MILRLWRERHPRLSGAIRRFCTGDRRVCAVASWFENGESGGRVAAAGGPVPCSMLVGLPDPEPDGFTCERLQHEKSVSLSYYLVPRAGRPTSALGRARTLWASVIHVEIPGCCC